MTVGKQQVTEDSTSDNSFECWILSRIFKILSISYIVLLLEKTKVFEENHRPSTNH